MQLEFVSPEEAAKWPEGCWVRCVKTDADGLVRASIDERWTPATRAHCERWSFNRFARLPDTLPGVERNE